MIKQFSLIGIGKGYGHIDSADPVTTANMKSRYMPFRDMSHGRQIMTQSGRNAGDPRVQWGATSHAGVQSAALDNNVRTY